jgi:hypothetical protein
VSRNVSNGTIWLRAKQIVKLADSASAPAARRGLSFPAIRRRRRAITVPLTAKPNMATLMIMYAKWCHWAMESARMSAIS